MKILILMDTTKLSGDIAKELFHLDGEVYIQYVDPNTKRASDIEKVKWDLCIVKNDVPGRIFVLTSKWRKSIAKSCNQLVYVD